MSRNRSLSDINHKILMNPALIETTLSEQLDKAFKKPLHVLEIGFGHGRALTELALLYKADPVIFHGVTLEQKSPVTHSESLIDIARKYEMAPESELKGFDPPKVHFYNATKLHFEDECISFIYSLVTIRFMDHKAQFLEEVCRVLKPGGIALLNLSGRGWNYPFGPASLGKKLTPYINRFVLKYKTTLVPLPVYLKLFEDSKFQFEFLNTDRCVLKITKLKSTFLDLDLEYNEDLSVSMRDFSYKNEYGKERGGFRTVYDVHADKWDSLNEMGLQPDVSCH